MTDSIPAELNYGIYLAGRPINEELAALREGRILEAEQPKVTTEEPPAPGRITRRDRLDLKELVALPGYRVLHRLIENATLEAQKRANVIAEDDPIGKAAELAQVFAYVKMRRLVLSHLIAEVKEELAKLEEEPDEAKPAKQGTQARRTPRASSGTRARKNQDNG